MSFPLVRSRKDPIHQNNTIQETVCQIFQTMKNKHRTGITTKKPATLQKLPHFIGLIIVENKTIHRLGMVSDYFQEHVKIDAKRFDQLLTPFEYWRKHPESTPEEIKRHSKPCTNFCGTILCCFIKTYKSHRILDFSAGWGDRLFAAMTYDHKIQNYTGIDPNKRLHTGYRQMIKQLLPKSSHYKYNLIEGQAEKIISTLEPDYFDLVFTSPPYFDLENYSSDSTQSIHSYPKFEDWYQKFLLVSIFNSVDCLQNGGILALNINNTKEFNLIDRLIADMRRQYFMKFLGIIYYGNPQCPTYIYQPILVWQKEI